MNLVSDVKALRQSTEDEITALRAERDESRADSERISTELNRRCDDIAAQVTTLTARLTELNGTPVARFHGLLDLLQQRFPDPEPYSARAYEGRFLAWLDALRAERDSLQAARDVAVEEFGKAEAEREALHRAIDPTGTITPLSALVALAEAHRSDSEDRDKIEDEREALRTHSPQDDLALHGLPSEKVAGVAPAAAPPTPEKE